jgi:hypothetical protein
MSTGPTGMQGQQGQQGYKGGRGPDGIQGGGYGTDTGPTGGIGSASMIFLSGAQTITLTTATSGSIYTLNGISSSGASFPLTTSGLGSGDSGIFWMFFNRSSYSILVSSYGVSPGQCITWFWNGSSLIGI